MRHLARIARGLLELGERHENRVVHLELDRQLDLAVGAVEARGFDVRLEIAQYLRMLVGIESRGFIFGCPLADRMTLPFVPVRKPGKLPAARASLEYSLEYGQSQLDIHEDAMPGGGTAYVVDDLLATGGTALAAAKLVEMVGGRVCGLGFLIELKGLGGRLRLSDYRAFAILGYD